MVRYSVGPKSRTSKDDTRFETVEPYSAACCFGPRGSVQYGLSMKHSHLALKCRFLEFEANSNAAEQTLVPYYET
jgi:hypothetical protein